MPFLTALLGPIGSLISGWFTTKQKQEDTMQNVIQNVAQAEVEMVKGAASIVSTEAGSEHWVTSVWRPLVMLNFMVLIDMYFFGYLPKNLQPGDIANLFDLVKIGLGGYIGARSVEKVVSMLKR